MTALPRRAALVVAALLATPLCAPADDDFFEKKVRPLLAEKCLNCHGGPGGKVKGGLKLTSRAALLEGGENGPSVVPGAPDKSPLVKAVLYTDENLKMPPKGKLSDAEIADLAKWVKDGAHWPKEAAVPANPEPKQGGPLFTAEQKAFWAFQPVKEPKPPVSTADPIDAFVLAKLKAAGLSPAPPADRRTLIRRVTFDLTGLPPTPEEVDAFLKDTAADAWEKVIDRLLASPAYGERWARHWLDVARYADSNGLDENTAFGNAWKYRDYVIKAFNDDKPYDRFLREQLAGDLLPANTDAARREQLTATGFLSLGPKVLAEPDKQKMLLDIADEQLDTVGKAFMGLTLGCARCHDHKFDPIPTRDYYSLLAVFTSTRTMQNLNTVAKAFERDPSGPEKPEVKADRAKLEQLKKDLRKLEQDFSKTPATEKEKRTEIHLKAEEKRAVVKKLEATVPVPTAVLAVEEPGGAGGYVARGRNLYVQVRGTYSTPGVEAPAVFPRIIAGEEQKPFVALKPNPSDKLEANKIRYGALREASGRLELANWLADPAHPLTPRVMVNRVWQHHFGEGLVRTPDNFGRLGERPTHPELLDWLAVQFTRNGWSLKKMHKLVLLSATYQMSATHDAKAALADPDNRLLWRFNRRRLEAEAVRDSMLAVAGTLDRTAGGSLLNNGNFEYVTNDQSRTNTRYDSTRRSIYLPVIRNNVFDFFQAFDFVEPHVSNSKRASTVIPSQALYLMNNPFVVAQARALADSLPKTDDDSRARAAYLRAFTRPATADEVSRAVSFVQKFDAALAEKEKDALARRAKAWAAWCQVLFASSEFVYVN